MLCYIFYPKCDSNKSLIHPCKETCHELLEACLGNAKLALKRINFRGARYGISPNIDVTKQVNCDYLPAQNGSIPCRYKLVTCGPPPSLVNTKIINRHKNDGIYRAMSGVQYECVNETFYMEGNSRVTCLYNGQWNKTPKCVKGNMNPLGIVIPLLTIPLIIFIIMCIIIKLTCQRKKLLKRNREYDSFVCYNFDEDHNFVFNSILPELEENHDPPLKVSIHDRDFIIGREITDNIYDAIENSNSAIIVMSQGFIDSPRCREEFTKCLAESEDDPAFKLFIILMEDVDALINVPENMKKFFREKTYLKRRRSRTI